MAFGVVVLLVHSGLIMVYHAAALYFDFCTTIHHCLHWFSHSVFLFSCWKIMQKTGSWVLFKFGLSWCPICLVCAYYLFCRIYQIQKGQHKQTRNLSSSNRGRLLNKVLWCLQILVECMKIIAASCVCV